MLYHYTSLDAFESIVRDSTSEQGLCFWASRFDCFGDTREYKLGIEEIHRLLPKLEQRLPVDRRVAQSFTWEEICRNNTLPNPYVVSFTDKNDNDYMWTHYGCDGRGIVLEIDDSQPVVNDYTKNLMVKTCLYQGEIDEKELYSEIENEYFTAAFQLLSGPQKTLMLALLSEYPQLFVALIGRYLLSYVAPRMKGNAYRDERETRIILAAPRIEVEAIIDQIGEDVRKQFDQFIDWSGYRRMMRGEKMRNRANGDIVYYREIFLPGALLKNVFVKESALLKPVRNVLDEKGFSRVCVCKI